MNQRISCLCSACWAHSQCTSRYFLTAFLACVFLLQRTSRSARGEQLGPLQSILWILIALHTHRALQVPENMLELSLSPCKCLFSRLIVKGLEVSLQPQLEKLPPTASPFNHCCWWVSQIPWVPYCLHRVSPELCHMRSSLRIQLPVVFQRNSNNPLGPRLVDLLSYLTLILLGFWFAQILWFQGFCFSG